MSCEQRRGRPVAEESSGANWKDLSGRLTQTGHVLPVRVYFEDTDFSGLVYHTSYMRWCERGRSDYLRLLGIGHSALLNGAFAGEPSAFAVRRLNAEFLKAARIDDVLEVCTSAAELTKASLILRQTIERDAQPIFRLEVQCVLLSASGRLLRMPAPMLSLLDP